MSQVRPKIAADEVPFGCEAEYAATYDVVPVEVRVYAPIPAGLDAMAPGAVLAGWLTSIDVSTVSPFDRIVVLRAHRRLASHFQAAMYRDMVAVADAEAEVWGDELALDVCDEAAGAEVGTALHLTRRGADIEMGFALDLFRRLPRLAQMLEAGIIDVARAKAIERSTTHLSDAAAQGVVDAVADTAGDLTTGQLRAEIRRLCIEADTNDAKDRYITAVEGRRVVAEATDAGTANLSGLDLAPERVQAAMHRINTIAQGLRGSDETRSMDQLRADVYLDLLNGTNHHTGGRGVVDITVDLATLTGLVDHPGDLGGYGPVIADIARRVAHDQIDAEWRVSVIDPDTGDLVAMGVTGRRPDAAQRRRIETRDRFCVFPGCRISATRSDIDHIIAVQDGGKTTDDNLAPLCRHHHRIKHDHRWTYTRLPNGNYQWTSPTGHTYTTNRAPP